MAWRFKASKYKNTAPIVPKKEDWITDIKVGSPQSCGNHIKASAAFVAFNVENRGGGSLACLPLGFKGRMEVSMPLIHGHSDLITDFDFSPFDDGMLVTGSTDANVCIWHIPEGGLTENLTNAEYTLPQFDKRIENVLFHPTTEYLLTVAYFDTVKLFDIKHEKEIYTFAGMDDQVQSCSWKQDGAFLVTSAKDKKIRIIDPRTDKVTHECEGHQSAKDSRVVWLGHSDRILSTGFSNYRDREVKLRDLRNFKTPSNTQTFDSSTGILMPLYDVDTNMLFLAGKADVSIMFWEVTEKDPFLTEGALKHMGSVQTKGACLVPKRGLDVMQGEVNRIMQLTPNSVIPITCQVPRKTYRDFHADIFPESNDNHEPTTTIAQWLDGINVPLKKISLDPAKKPNGVNDKFQIHRGPLSKREEESSHIQEQEAPRPAPRSCVTNGSAGKPSDVKFSKPTVAVKDPDGISEEQPEKTDEEPETKPCGVSISELRKNWETKEEHQQEVEDEIEETPSKMASIRKQFENRSISVDEKIVERRREEVRQETTIQEEEKENVVELRNKSTSVSVSAAERRKTFEARMSVEEKPASPTPRRSTATRSFRRACKFRHLKGTPGHRSTQIENVRDMNRTTPGECDVMAASAEFVALPLSGPGGKLAVYQHKKGGRLPDGVIPSLVNGATIMDFAFDPFDNHSIAVVCDDGKIHLWQIPEGGLISPTNEPNQTFCDSSDKVTIVKWHPLSKGIIAVAAGDHSIKIWDLPSERVSIVLEGHTDQVFSISWSPCGRYLASVCRDTKIRMYEPRKSLGPIKEGQGPLGVRGARVFWALDGKFLVTCGFSKTSDREISVYAVKDISKPLNTVSPDVSPAILIPFYDPDSSTLFATGKGDSTILAYEVGSDHPHLFPLSSHRSNSVHQGLALLPKYMCDVRSVEFCKALRLTQSIIEPISFTVPRVKTEFFQDDIFPPTHINWESVMTSSEWLEGSNLPPKYMSLQPQDMQTLSESKEGSCPTPKESHPPGHVRQETPPFLKGMVTTEIPYIIRKKNIFIPEDVQLQQQSFGPKICTSSSTANNLESD
ncbi:unnamed protein product, partial [Meganyctiphanes norvegica]